MDSEYGKDLASFSTDNIQGGQSVDLYLESLQKPGQLTEIFTEAEFLKRINSHFERLEDKKADWNHSIYDWLWYWKSGMSLFKDEEISEELVGMQAENGIWGNQSFPQSALIDTLMVLQTLAEKNLPIPNADLIATGLNELIDGCIKYKGQDFVAFELIFSQQIKYLLHHPSTMNIINDLLGNLFSGPALAKDPDDKATAFQKIIYVGDKIGKGAWKLNLSRTSGLLFDQTKTFSFALETLYFIEDISENEINALMNMVHKNGSIGFSPAATAGIIQTVRKFYDKNSMPVPEEYQEKFIDMIAYLEQTLVDYNCQSIPNLHPIDTSGDLWNMLSLFLSGNWKDLREDTNFAKLLLDMYQRIERTPNGVGWAIGQTLMDLDDTSTTFELQQILQIMGIEIPHDEYGIGAIESFQEICGRIHCYEYEGDPSFGSANHTINALETALRNPNLDEDSRQKVLSLLNSVTSQMTEYFIRGYGYSPLELMYDKWHASKFYGGRSILSNESMFLAAPETVNEIINIIADSQKEDGSFGELEASTIEETSYTISSLYAFLKNTDKFEAEFSNNPKYLKLFEKREAAFKALEKAKGYFDQTLKEKGIEISQLWISKNLYSANFQIISAVLNAKYILDSKIDFENSQLIGNVESPVVNLAMLKPNKAMQSTSTIMQQTRALTGKKAKYFTDGEKFSTLWATMLDINDGSYRIVNILMICFDALAENRKPEDFKIVADELEDLVNYDNATKFLETADHSDLDSSIENSLKYALSFLVVKASESEQIKDKITLENYLNYVKSKLRAHNKSQASEARTIGGNMSEVMKNLQLEISQSNNTGVKEIMRSYIDTFGESIGISPIVGLCLPHSPGFDQNFLSIVDGLMDVYSKMLATANQLLMKPEQLNMGLFLASVLDEVPVDDNLRMNVFGKYFDEINEPDDNPTHRTKSMMELQMKMQSIFFGQMYPEFIQEIQAKLNEAKGKLNPSQILMIDRLHTSLLNIANKLGTDDIDMVMGFLEIPIQQQIQMKTMLVS